MKIAPCFALICVFGYCASTSITRNLPDDLLIGTATSSYQVEGAWNTDGKGENIWDHMVHTQPEKIADGNNGDVACDAYHKTKTDVALLKRFSFQFYRFSLSWTRILPFGDTREINQKGLAYYHELIDELLANDIEPVVTIYHWDLPQPFQDLGGWTNSLIITWFVDYCDVVFREFGNKVKLWITINEPRLICQMGYGTGLFAPGIQSGGIGEYICGRNVLLAHAEAFHLYKSSYRKENEGRIGITIDASWSEPSTNSTADAEAAERRRQFDFGIYAHPIFSRNGDYPKVVKEFVANRSRSEGFKESRLPKFTNREIRRLRGSSDFFGLNYYTSYLVKDRLADPIGLPSNAKDIRVEEYQRAHWLTGSNPGFKSVPWGFRKLLKYIKKSYANPDIYITENGFPDLGELDDEKRLEYYWAHVIAMLDAIEHDKVRIKAYTAWSFMDVFEWISGYTIRFGLFHVDFNNPNRTRTPKVSAKFFKFLSESRNLTYEV